MKLLLLTTFAATICYGHAGKRARLLAALNGGLLGGMNSGLIGGLNGGLGNGVNPRIIAGGRNLPMVAGGGAGFAGQPQFAQFVPRLPAFAVPPPIPNMYPLPAMNAFPYMGVGQMSAMNTLQQPLVGLNGGPMQQSLPPQPDLLKRFRRQIIQRDNTVSSTVDTQIPAPTETTTTTPCDGDHHKDY